MKTTDIVKLFEEYVQRFNDKAVIVLKKNLDKCAFKAYKKLTYSLYFSHRISGQGFMLVSMDDTARVTTPEEEEALFKKLDERLFLWMLDWVRKNNLIYANE